VITKGIHHMTFGLAVSGRIIMLIKENFFQHQLCMFSPGDGHLQKMASCNL